jgi:acyl transferase domain-containing protein
MHADTREPIAIVGLGLRTAGAATRDDFWRLLCQGQDALREVPADRWSSVQPSHARGGFVEGIDQFDWRAFRIPPHEAEQLDPQQRLLLETAWESLEDACLPLDELRGARGGVFIGMNPVDYQRLLTRDWSRLDGYAILGTTAALAANRISHTFGLVGPSLVLNMACASSLAAIHYACQSLWSGDADLALAGGVELMLSPDSSIMLEKAGMLSTSGRQRALDSEADGYVRGEGVGMLTLRRLSDVQPGERVYALLRGSALNHNGPGAWVTDASSDAQADVFVSACTSAAIPPSEVEYVELHGAALPKGDRAEIVAIGAAAAGTDKGGRARPCRIGTLTNNIGYLGAAGGVAAVIKVALSFHHQLLPPTINVEAPLAELSDLGLHPQVALESWTGASQTAFAGVLSTSLGGANASVVLCSAPTRNEQNAPTVRDQTDDGLFVLPLSGHTAGALREQVRRYAQFLAELDESRTPLDDVCYTASVRRAHHQYRLAVCGGWREALLARLEAERNSSSAASGTFLPRIVFVNVAWDAQDQQCMRRLREAWPPLRTVASSDPGDAGALEKLLAACGIRPELTVSIERGDPLPSPLDRFDDQAPTWFIVLGGSSGFALEAADGTGARVLYTCGADVPAEHTFIHTLMDLYATGYDVRWSGLFPGGGQCADLPTYAFQRQRFWPAWLSGAEPNRPSDTRAAEVRLPETRRQLLAAGPLTRSQLLSRYLYGCVEGALSTDRNVALSPDTRWFDLGLTSLALIQLARRFEQDLGVDVSVGDFFEFSTLDVLCHKLLGQMFETPHNSLTPVRPREAPQLSPARRDLSELGSQIDRMSESEAATLLRQRLSALQDLD